MKYIYLSLLFLTGVAKSDVRPLPPWILAEHKAIVTTVDVLPISRKDGQVVSGYVKFKIANDITKNWKNVDTLEIKLVPQGIGSGWISSNKDLWLLTPPKKGDQFFIFSNKPMVDLNEPHIKLMLITDDEIDNVTSILAIESLEKDSDSKSGKFSKYLRGRKSSSRFLWQYFQYLIGVDQACIKHLGPVLSKIANDDKNIYYISDIMSEFGYMGQMTPEIRKLGVETTYNYLVADRETPIPDDVAKSFIWLKKFKGSAPFTNQEKANLRVLSEKIEKKNYKNISPEIKEALLEAIE